MGSAVVKGPQTVAELRAQADVMVKSFDRRDLHLELHDEYSGTLAPFGRLAVNRWFRWVVLVVLAASFVVSYLVH